MLTAERLTAASPAMGGIHALFQRLELPSGRRGDLDGNPGLDMLAPSLRDAAVLVPLIDRVEGPTILFTQRTAHLAAHAGQISFPGGGVEPDDTGPVATALRETEEEIGLDRQHIHILGRLDTYITRTGFRVVPIVAHVTPPFTLTPDPNEVDAVFEVPLTFILNPASRVRESREYKGALRHFWAFPYGERYIWGATAGMLINLCDVLADAVEHTTA